MLLLVWIWAGGCAQIEAPRGGPVDTEPPRVIATFPDSGEVMVPLVDSIAIVFSEPMDRSSVESSFFLSPAVEYRERRWDRQTWILRLREPLREGRTYVGLLGTGIRDRQRLSPREAWSFAFSTGESLDTGVVSGTVLGRRYPPKGALIYVWPWESGLPDTLVEGFPEDPLRLGQADAQGAYRVEHLPRGRRLQVCALYDREQDRRFDPRRDRWGCLDAPIILGDTIQVLRGVDLYLTSPEEPGTVAGSVVDSSCVQAAVPARMAGIAARRDSLREWVEPMRGAESATEPTGAGAGWVRGLTRDDSLRIEQEFLLLEDLEREARRDSLWCAIEVAAHLIDQDSVLVRESYGSAAFRWSDIPPGIYRLKGFRDMNGNRRYDQGEPGIWYPHAIEIRPLRVVDDLDLVLPPILDAVRAGAAARDTVGPEETDEPR